MASRLRLGRLGQLPALVAAGGCLGGGGGAADAGDVTRDAQPARAVIEAARDGGREAGEASPEAMPDGGREAREPTMGGREADESTMGDGDSSDVIGGMGEASELARDALSGTIVFEQAHDYGFVEHQGISTYDIDADRLTLLVDGIKPRRHPTSGETAFLQQCADIPGDGVYYRVAIADVQGLAMPITPCSLDIPNPTTGVFLLEDRTEFDVVSLSPDASKVSVTLRYAILSEDQSFVMGEAVHTAVYNREGELVTELPDADDAAWLPDGRLLFVFGNQFFLTDENLENPLPINDGSVLSSAVNNPAVHPSGEYFVFEYNSQFWRMNIDGTGLSRLLALDKWLRYPTWSPDGEKLLFTVWEGGTSRSTLTSFFFIDVEADTAYRIDIGHHLMTLAEPWGPLSWVQ